MRTTSFIAIVIAGIIGFSSIATESKAQRVSVNFSLFQSELGRYGRWMHHPRFGDIWIYNEPGFRPYYSNGRWDYTEYGWEWISDYDWGWAPFHYGRWELDPMYGWIWIPGYEWAPAWVSWGEYGDYYGWAPLGFGVSIDIGIGAIPYDRWTYCNRSYINQRGFRDYCVPFARNSYYYQNTRVINNFYGERNGRYSAGPQRREAERYFGYALQEHHYDRDNRYRDRDNDNNRYENNRRNNSWGDNDNRNNNGNGFGNRNRNETRGYNPGNDDNRRRNGGFNQDNNSGQNNAPWNGNNGNGNRPSNNDNNRNGYGNRPFNNDNNRNGNGFGNNQDNNRRENNGPWNNNNGNGNRPSNNENNRNGNVSRNGNLSSGPEAHPSRERRGRGGRE